MDVGVSRGAVSAGRRVPREIKQRTDSERKREERREGDNAKRPLSLLLQEEDEVNYHEYAGGIASLFGLGSYMYVGISLFIHWLIGLFQRAGEQIL